jgi:GPI-anchor transamidase subunit GAA1
MNARLPNQDLLNSIQIIAQWTGQAPVLLYDHSTPHHDASKLQKYESKAINVLKHVGYQTFGRPSGVHGLFHQ